MRNGNERAGRRRAVAPGVAILVGGALLAACGGNAVQAPPDDGNDNPIPLLSFQAIAGTWIGDAVEASGEEFWVDANLESSARQGQPIGTIAYGVGDPAEAPAVCGGDWIALSAQDPVYTVRERITFAPEQCPDGTVRLDYDAAAGTLAYDFTPDVGGATASGVLGRK